MARNANMLAELVGEDQEDPYPQPEKLTAWSIVHASQQISLGTGPGGSGSDSRP